MCVYVGSSWEIACSELLLFMELCLVMILVLHNKGQILSRDTPTPSKAVELFQFTTPEDLMMFYSYPLNYSAR